MDRLGAWLLLRPDPGARRGAVGARAEALNARLAANWDSFRARLRATLLPAAALEAVLARAGAPRQPEDLYWPCAFYRDAVRHAREIRDRYTFLDLAADSGMLEQ